jgi:TatD DNase family protein
MVFIDTHIHLDADEFNPDLPDVIGKACSQGVKLMLVPNVDRNTASRVIEICNSYPGICFPMMGVHPTSVKEDFEEELAEAEGLLKKSNFIAIGEIGIDLYWDKTFYREQEKAFVYQMNLARELSLPVVIHSRKSLDEILQIIKKEHLQDIPGVFHCFPGSVEQARKVISMGYKLGIGGVITFKNASLADVVKETAIENLVLETDAPWLAPVPFRGKRNEPSYITIIAQKIAEIKGITLDEVAEITTQTAMELFPKIRGKSN